MKMNRRKTLENRNQELTVIDNRQVATRTNPMDALALMSESEFEQRLESLKVAQKRMARIQRELMQEDVDYGVIPGTGDKPTLLKPGAEKLCKFHHLVPTFEEQILLGDGVSRPHIRVLTTCSLHYESEVGPIVGQGMGAANSWEKKHRWRETQRKCPSCGAAAIYRSKYPDKNTGELGWYCFGKKGGCGATFGEKDAAIIDQQQGQTENPDPFDLENTLRKISAKRSQTDATLRTTATSGLFTQDVEDMAGEDGVKETARPAAQRPVPQAARQQHATPAEPTAKTNQRNPWPTIPEKFQDAGEFVAFFKVNFGLLPTKVWQEAANLTNGAISRASDITDPQDYVRLAHDIRGVYGTNPNAAPPAEPVEGAFEEAS